jgi:D-beta-D-heptose 7-phosphate kinase/D-beta-D-heptose 1-phosphate adenosyltransferase
MTAPPVFSRAQVLVVGDLMLDRYWTGDTGRISPEAPVPVVLVGHTEDRPGGAGNVALNLASLGAGACVISLVGRDDAAAALERTLTAAGVHCDFVASASAPTITKLRVLSRHQQLLRMDFEQPFAADDCAALPALVQRRAEGVGALILSDYAKGTLNQCQQLIALARARQLPVLVDPKGSDYSRYRGATLLTPNLQEFELVAGPCNSEKELVEKGCLLIEQFDLQALLITRGEQGMTLIQRDAHPLHMPARAREVYDVTGAGDTVIATLAAGLAAGESLARSVELANIAAGIVVGKLGTATVSGPELRRALAAEGHSGRGVMSEEQLLAALADARAQGEKVVFTNGCFDILHAGHVGYLEQARRLGDRLIVAINGDASVTRLKGEGRPINPVERRMAVLAGLEAVDWVTSFDDDTPERLLEVFKPDVLVKGGDYNKEQVVGWQIVESYGGQVRSLDFLDNCSTTAIVEKIKK